MRDGSGQAWPRRRLPPRPSWAALLAAALLAAAPPTASAQERGCALEARVGPAVPSGGHGARLEADLGLALGAACPVADRMRIGTAVARDQLDRYGFIQFQATVDFLLARLSPAGARLELRGAAAWARGDRIGARLVGADPGAFTRMEDGAWGPSVGTSVRLWAPLGGPLSLIADAGWRVAWVDRIRFQGFEPVDRTTESLDWFPLSVGLLLEL